MAHPDAPAKETDHMVVDYDDATGRKMVNQYMLLRDIGRGCHGRVKLAVDITTGQHYAIKIIDKAQGARRLSARWTSSPNTTPWEPPPSLLPPHVPTAATSVSRTRSVHTASSAYRYQGFPHASSPLGNGPSPPAFPVHRSLSRPPSRNAPPTTTPGPTDKIRKEIAVLKKCCHPHIVRLYEVIDDPAARKIYLVLEYLEGGEIQWRDADDRPLLDLDEVRTIFRDLVLGVEYLHYQGIIHRDIKPANLLRDAAGRVKISDFGVSHFHQQPPNHPSSQHPYPDRPGSRLRHGTRTHTSPSPSPSPSISRMGFGAQRSISSFSSGGSLAPRFRPLSGDYGPSTTLNQRLSPDTSPTLTDPSQPLRVDITLPALVSGVGGSLASDPSNAATMFRPHRLRHTVSLPPGASPRPLATGFTTTFHLSPDSSEDDDGAEYDSDHLARELALSRTATIEATPQLTLARSPPPPKSRTPVLIFSSDEESDAEDPLPLPPGPAAISPQLLSPPAAAVSPALGAHLGDYDDLEDSDSDDFWSDFEFDPTEAVVESFDPPDFSRFDPPAAAAKAEPAHPVADYSVAAGMAGRSATPVSPVRPARSPTSPTAGTPDWPAALPPLTTDTGEEEDAEGGEEGPARFARSPVLSTPVAPVYGLGGGFNDSDRELAKTAGSPAFFAPELCCTTPELIKLLREWRRSSALSVEGAGATPMAATVSSAGGLPLRPHARRPSLPGLLGHLIQRVQSRKGSVSLGHPTDAIPEQGEPAAASPTPSVSTDTSADLADRLHGVTVTDSLPHSTPPDQLFTSSDVGGSRWWQPLSPASPSAPFPRSPVASADATLSGSKHRRTTSSHAAPRTTLPMTSFLPHRASAWRLADPTPLSPLLMVPTSTSPRTVTMVSASVSTAAAAALEQPDTGFLNFPPSPTPSYHGITKAIDIWAMGVTLYCLVYGRCPFVADNEFELFQIIPRQPLQFPGDVRQPDIPASLRDLLARLMEKDYQRRITIEEVKHHPWLVEGLADAPQWAKDTDVKNHYPAVRVTSQDIQDALVPSFQWSKRITQGLRRLSVSVQKGLTGWRVRKEKSH
ncbi:hypothetical protein IWQ60_002835 [Tieghemiomyces parasiticus]|uniref:Protein kinase domain-containing protein n=1 Tax=Tieghemiomyces parasiticus TaxID=78921 RepID=A0A9W8AAL8_9FUNG|nr:hypothetical protein IWQ60_002835 [Tieghemiomyces parasiticus]